MKAGGESETRLRVDKQWAGLEFLAPVDGCADREIASHDRGRLEAQDVEVIRKILYAQSDADRIFPSQTEAAPDG